MRPLFGIICKLSTIHIYGWIQNEIVLMSRYVFFLDVGTEGSTADTADKPPVRVGRAYMAEKGEKRKQKGNRSGRKTKKPPDGGQTADKVPVYANGDFAFYLLYVMHNHDKKEATTPTEDGTCLY